MKSGTIFWGLLVLLTVVRVALVLDQDVSPREAYYHLCAAQPAPAYFDGPGGTAWSIRALEPLAGEGTAWRMLAPFWAALAGVAAYALARTMGAGNHAGWAGVAVSVLPAVTADSLRVGPGLPAFTLCTFALACCWKAFAAEKRGFAWWLVAGILFALAVNFSYLSALLIPAVVLFGVLPDRHRACAARVAGLALVVLLPAVALVPALRWNAAQDWIPLAGGTLKTFWLFHLLEGTKSFIHLAQTFSPFMLILFGYAWVAAARDARIHLRARFAGLTALAGLLVGVYFLLRGWDATLPVLLAAAPLLAFASLSVQQASLRWLLLVAVVTGAAFSVAAGLAAFRAGSGWTAPAQEVRSLFLEKTAEGEEGLFLIAQDPDLASILAWHLRNDLIPPPGYPTVFSRESQDISSQFSLWAGYDDFIETEVPPDESFTEQKGENPFMGRSALYISREPLHDLPQSIKGAFESVALLKTLPKTPGTQEPLYIYFCLIYQTLPL